MPGFAQRPGAASCHAGTFQPTTSLRGIVPNGVTRHSAIPVALGTGANRVLLGVIDAGADGVVAGGGVGVAGAVIAHPASKAQSSVPANVVIVHETVRVGTWLRNDPGRCICRQWCGARNIASPWLGGRQ